uniref:autotransporter outer membrane beta-barrel domain-containing protein n=1 Tax=Microbulbifer agarilyticus TaxID=260552 RepID=UPI000255912C|nr:autotransporter outer membrane beta-barrel domain-containing protein [Microbulbifer agarilyticus]
MANNKGFPSNPSQLTSAVRKALFTSATVTAIAVGAPGHNAYAQQVGACNPISTEFTGGTVECSGAFDETINYQVQDSTLVSGEVTPGDITVVVAEGSTANGIEVSSIVPASGEAEAQGSVSIDNHGDLTQGAGAALEIPEENIIHFGDDYGLRKSGSQGNYSGYTYTGSVALDADGNAVGDTTTFTDGVVPADLAGYLGVDESVLDGNLQDNGGPIEDLSIVIAAEGELQFDDIAAISAETDAGAIDIANTGDISMGSGLQVEYHTRYSINSGAMTPIDVDTDGDGVDDLRLYAERNQVFLPEQDRAGNRYRFETSASVVGIDAASASGDITISNAGSIDAGDVAFGVRSHTDSGDIDISNTGDISVGADSVGISATTSASAELVYQYGYTVDNGVTFEPGNASPFKYKETSYTHNTTDYVGKIYNADGGDSRIEIANAGNITVGAAGTGILAHNPSGDAIVIDNSGDITVGAGVGGTGIDADATAGFSTQYNVDYAQTPGCGGFFGPACEPLPYETNVAPGEGVVAGDSWYTNDLNGDGVETPTKHYYNHTVKEGVGYVEDMGDITIVNSGTIDISAATEATGIRANTLGAAAIENSGSILVGKNSTGISTSGAGETLVINSGDVQLDGEGSQGLQISSYINHRLKGNDSISPEEIYSGFDRDVLNDAYAGFGGDTNVYNTGSISGNTVKEDALVYNEVGDLVTTNPNLERSVGIQVSTTNSNLKGTDVPFAMYGPESVAAWNEEKSADLSYRDSIEFFETNVINTGDIALGDLSTGIRLSATYGEATIINSGNVSVGDGVLGERYDTFNPVRLHSVGISANPGGDSWANNTVINTADGAVTAGDIGMGLIATSVSGDAMVINDGTVTVGSGATIEASEHRETDFTINSAGIQSSVVLGVDSYALAANNGTVTTGDNSVGIQSTNFTGPGFFTSAFDHQATAVASNTGVVSTGDNSFGLAVGGASNLGYNSGDITIGSGDFYTTSYTLGSAAMGTVGGLQGSLYTTLVNVGNITTGDNTAGIAAEGFVFSAAVQTEDGQITTGDNTFGMQSIGYIQGVTQNAGAISTGDNSIGMRTYAIYAAGVNSGDIEVGSDSTGMSIIGASAYVNNVGDIATGDNGTGIEVFSGTTPTVVANTGNIITGDNGVAIEMEGQDYLNMETGQVIANLVFNGGNITGSIITGDSDDVLRNGFRYDNSGNIAGVGRITLNDAAIDMGAGRNTFINESGDIVFSGDSAIDLGAQGSMVNYSGGANYVTISSLDDQVGDTLTINSDVTFANIQSVGSLFLVDVSSTANDSIVINGDLNVVDLLNEAGDTQPGDLRIAMNVTDQSKGAQTTAAILTVNGEQEVDSVSLAALGGDFADTILEAEMQQDGNGNWVIAYTAGLSDLGAAASSVSHLAESFWMRSTSAFFDSERANNIGETSRVAGLHAWSSVFHTDSDIDSKSDLAAQNLAYTQLLSNQMAGATYNAKLGSSWLSISPMVGQGSADGNQLAQQSGAALDTETFALNATFSLRDFYVSAMAQQVDFDAHIHAYDSAAATSGKAEGVSMEAGWTYLMESGMALTPFAQWEKVGVEVDSFSSSDGNYDYNYELNSTHRARLGLSLRKSFKLADGFASPYATFSANDVNNAAIHDLTSNDVRFGSDINGSGLNIDFGVDGKYKLWTFKSGLGVHSGETDKNGLSGHFAISRSL